MKTALRVGWRAGVGRGGAAVGADRRGQGGGAWRGGMGPARSSGALGVCAPLGPALHGSTEAMGPSFAGVSAAAAPANSGGAEEGAPAEANLDASHPTPRRGSPERRKTAASGPDGPGAWDAADRRPAPSRASGVGAAAARTVARRFPTPRRGRKGASGASSEGPERVARPGFAGFGMGFGWAFESCPIMQAYRTSPHPRQAGRISRSNSVTKRRARIHHRQVIRADLDPRSRPPRRPRRGRSRAARQARANQGRTSPKAPETQAFPPPAAVPAWARASGRAGESDPLFFAGAGLALLDAYLRRDPPAAGALRARLALQSAAASAKILRLNADAAALRDLRFAIGDRRASAGASCFSCGATCAGRPPSLDARRLADAAARPRPVPSRP